MPALLLVALLAGTVVGSQLPDIDQWLFFLVGQHRSVLTHSPLIPWGLYLASRGRNPAWAWFGAGLAAAFAAHFARDLFPSMWVGYANITVPFVGRLGGTLSMLVLLTSVVGCWYLALLLIDHRKLVPMVALAAGVGFALELARGRWPLPLVMPALVLALGFCVAACIPNPVIDGAAAARRWWAVASATTRR